MFKINLVKKSPAGARVMKIEYNGKNILTMQRVLTSTEINYNTELRKAKIPTPNYSEQDFFEYRKNYTLINLRKLHKGNGSLFQTHLKELRPYVKINRDKIKVFRPVMKFDESPSWSDIIALIDLASHVGFDLIALPDSFYFKPSKYAELILKAREYAKELFNLGIPWVEIMPTINVFNKIEFYKEKLEIVKNLKFNFVNIENGYYPKHYPHYSFLRKFAAKAKNMCIYGSNAPRLHKANWKTSGIHLYVVFGQDIISQGIPEPFISKEGKKSVHDDPKSRFRFFDREQDALIKRGEYNLRYGEELIFSSPYCHGETLTSFMNKYNNQMLKIVMKIIEFGESAKTLSQEKDAVLGGNYEYEMQRKGVIWNLIKSLSQKTLV